MRKTGRGQVEDGMNFCPSCGAQIPKEETHHTYEYGNGQYTQNQTEQRNFREQTVKEEGTDRVPVVLAYLGLLVFVPILSGSKSEFVRFHANQGLIAPIAAKQGAHRRLNTRKEYAATCDMLFASVPQISCPSSATSANPKSCPNVPTTFSFATSPVIAATVIFQFPHPSGAKIHAIRLPILARIHCA